MTPVPKLRVGPSAALVQRLLGEISCGLQRLPALRGANPSIVLHLVRGATVLRHGLDKRQAGSILKHETEGRQ